MKWLKIVRSLGMVLFLLVPVSLAYAFSAEDYYHAGLQLYNSKDYNKSVQYFNAALKMDPNNAAALQGRGNCYYALGQYSNALADYQKVQTLKPSPQLTQFIQKIQAKIGATAPANAPAASPFDQGTAFFQHKQYDAAAPLFEKAVQQNPNDFKAYYYLGVTYKMIGDNRNAAVALGISNQKHPDPSVAAYVSRVRAKLTPQDQDWVDAQLASSAHGAVVTLHTKPPDETDFGIRLQASMVFLNLADFLAQGKAGQAYAIQQQETDPSSTYDATLPTASALIGFEPVLKLDTNFELGFPIATIPAGTFSEKFQNSSTNFTDSFDITGFSLGINLRYVFSKGAIRPFISAGPVLVPIIINYSSTMSSVPTTGSFSSLGLGGQAQLGVDVHLGENFAFGPYVGYQLASANSFSGTVTNNANSLNTTGELETVPGGTWSQFTVVETGQTAPTGARPVQVDLSGFVAGFQFGAFF